ncbi:MAG: membrane dipeptidase [Phycisphaerae bacterium]|nr:membrane dipeptidase [Phycisphaerae bacterium]
MLFFDGHLDLAMLAVHGRNMHAPPAVTTAGTDPVPAAVTLPSLREGNVRFALATIFTEADGDGPEGYPAGDAERAHRRGRAQLEVYETWRDEGRIAISLPKFLRHDPHVGHIRAGMGVAQLQPLSLEERLSRAKPGVALHVGILMENADPIRSPDELAWWKERGVMAVGLAWARPSRYAMGNMTPHDEPVGLTDLGREMVRTMDALGIVHDVSHLSDRAMDELLALTDRPVIASHSNCRALLNDPTNQRHLRDESIREIARRGGVIGLNLCRNFIAPQPYSKDDPRPTIEQTIAHVEHICGLVGHRNAVGLGSDLDGGFSADDLPEGINRPSDLARLTDALKDRAWSDDDRSRFAHENWAHFFGHAV